MSPTDGDSIDVFNSEPGDPDYLEFVTTQVVLGVSDWSVSSFVFDEYIGSGEITFDLAKAYAATLTDNSLGGSGTLRQASTLTTGSFSAGVTYEYTPVPELSSFALIAGAFGLGWVMVRRRQ